jgi:sugar (pentulose or hexulose) kinase
MDLFIGLDVGTSAVKGVLLASNGERIVLGKKAIRFVHPQADFTEIDPEEHVRSVFALIRDLSDQAPMDGIIRGISMAIASGNALLLDEHDKPLCNIISWLDGRAVNKTRELLPGLDIEGFQEVVGWPYGEFFPMAQIAWFRKNNPQSWRRVARVCMNNDYLFYRLTGKWGMDPSTASTFHLYDQINRCWHKPYIDLLGIDEQMLSTLLDSGEVLGSLTEEAAKATGLPETTVAVLGAFDHPSAARGTGALNVGKMLLSCGTSWVGFYPIEDRALGISQQMLMDSFLTPSGPWGAMAALTAIGVTIDKHIDQYVLAGESSPIKKYEIFNKAAVRAPVGSGGLFVDLYQGRMAFLSDVKNQFASHSQEEVSRALMEGAAFEVRRLMERLDKVGITAEEVTMVGGPTESTIWPQIVADVTGCHLKLINGQTAGAVGAAIMAAIGYGLFESEQQGFQLMGGSGRIVGPDSHRVRQYNSLYANYMEKFKK